MIDFGGQRFRSLRDLNADRRGFPFVTDGRALAAERFFLSSAARVRAGLVLGAAGAFTPESYTVSFDDDVRDADFRVAKETKMFSLDVSGHLDLVGLDEQLATVASSTDEAAPTERAPVVPNCAQSPDSEESK